jgi:hypothetical protein
VHAVNWQSWMLKVKQAMHSQGLEGKRPLCRFTCEASRITRRSICVGTRATTAGSEKRRNRTREEIRISHSPSVQPPTQIGPPCSPINLPHVATSARNLFSTLYGSYTECAAVYAARTDRWVWFVAGHTACITSNNTLH